MQSVPAAITQSCFTNLAGFYLMCALLLCASNVAKLRLFFIFFAIRKHSQRNAVYVFCNGPITCLWCIPASVTAGMGSSLLLNRKWSGVVDIHIRLLSSPSLCLNYMSAVIMSKAPKLITFLALLWLSFVKASPRVLFFMFSQQIHFLSAVHFCLLPTCTIFHICNNKPMKSGNRNKKY